MFCRLCLGLHAVGVKLGLLLVDRVVQLSLIRFISVLGIKLIARSAWVVKVLCLSGKFWVGRLVNAMEY